MKRAKIYVDYEADIEIVQENIASELKKKLHLNWSITSQEQSPYKHFDEEMTCWYDKKSNIYIAVYSKESTIELKRNDIVFLHVYNNIPMWNLEINIKELLKEIGALEPELALSSYVRAVAQGALKLLEFSN